MDGYICPPWYECSCKPGMPVSLSTMNPHRRLANHVRASRGRGPFKRGPKVTSDMNIPYRFSQFDSLESRETDDESYSIEKLAVHENEMMPSDFGAVELQQISVADTMGPSSEFNPTSTSSPGTQHTPASDAVHWNSPPLSIGDRRHEQSQLQCDPSTPNVPSTPEEQPTVSDTKIGHTSLRVTPQDSDGEVGGTENLHAELDDCVIDRGGLNDSSRL